MSDGVLKRVDPSTSFFEVKGRYPPVGQGLGGQRTQIECRPGM